MTAETLVPGVGRKWAGPEIRDSWAAGLWVRLFNAKEDAADGGGPQLERLAAEVDERLFARGPAPVRLAAAQAAGPRRLVSRYHGNGRWRLAGLPR